MPNRPTCFIHGLDLIEEHRCPACFKGEQAVAFLKRRYRHVLVRTDEGWEASIPELGVSTRAPSYSDAIQQLYAAALEWAELETYHGRPVPAPRPSYFQVELVFRCRCGNEARYSTGLCGVCDVLAGGHGVRIDAEKL